MDLPEVSIISPVYNVQQFLPTFFNSVVSQSFTNWELIMVNDGSTDESGKLCYDFSNTDERIKVFSKENGGVSSARNLGLSKAKGAYIYFADPDDELLPDCLKTLVDYMGDGVDLVSASYERIVEGRVESKIITPPPTVYDLPSFLEEITHIPNARWLERYLVTKLFKHKTIEDYGLHFDSQLSYREDVVFLFSYLIHCKNSIVTVNKDVYRYYRRSSGLALTGARSSNLDFYFSLIKCFKLLGEGGTYKAAKRNLVRDIKRDYQHAYRIIHESAETNRIKGDLNSINEEMKSVSLIDYSLLRVKFFLRPIYRFFRSCFNKK